MQIQYNPHDDCVQYILVLGLGFRFQTDYNVQLKYLIKTLMCMCVLYFDVYF